MDPSSIRRTEFPHGRVFYFDEKAWVLLAKPATDPRALARLHDAFQSGALTVPLSLANIVETVRSPDRNHRARLAELMLGLSGGKTIAPQYAVVRQEIACAIAICFGLPEPPPPRPYGTGISFAFGNLPPANSLMEQFGPHQVGLLSEFLATAEGMRAMLTGPTDDAFKAVSLEFVNGARKYAQDADAARSFLRPFSRSYRKRAYMASVASMVDTDVRVAASSLGVPYDEITRLGPSGLTRLFEDVPCLHVEIELGSRQNEFWNRLTAPNDLADVASLSTGIPYSDVAITEKFWTDLAIKARLDTKYATRIIHSIPALLDAMETLSSD